MTTLQATTPDRIDPTGGIHHLSHALIGALGIQVILSADVPPSQIGQWESTTSTLLVRPDTTPEQQTWLVVQLMEFLGVGHHCGSGFTQPVLTLVPPP